jgi:hypothetical protein
MNKILNLNFFILIFGLLIYGIFNTLATYSYKRLGYLGASTEYIFILEMLFIIIAYCFKIPLYYYFSGSNKIITLHILDLCIYSLVVVLYTKYYAKETIRLQSIIVLIAILGLTILNELVTF